LEKKGKLMQKLLLFSLVLLGLLPSVVAQSRALDKLANSFKMVFGKIFLLPMIGLGFVFWAKFIIWLLIFTLLFAASSMPAVLRDKKNIRLVITMVIALISVIPMTEPLLRAIFQTYGTVVSFLLIAVPIVGMLYFLHVALPASDPGTRRLHFALKAVAFFILGAIIQSLLSVQDFQFLPDFRNYGELAVGICFLLFWWYLIRAILAGSGGPEEGPPSGGGFMDWLKGLGRPGAPTTPTTPPGGAGTTPTPSTDHISEDLNSIRDQIVQMQGLLPQFRTTLQGLLDSHTRWVLNPATTDDAEIRDGYARLNDLRNGITGHHDTAQDLFSRIRNDPTFTHLPAAEQTRYQQLMNSWWRMYHIFGRHMDDFYRHVETIHRGP